MIRGSTSSLEPSESCSSGRRPECGALEVPPPQLDEKVAEVPDALQEEPARLDHDPHQEVVVRVDVVGGQWPHARRRDGGSTATYTAALTALGHF